MNGFVKSPWKWNEIFEVCSKYLFLLELLPTGARAALVDFEEVSELQSLSATEADEIYLNNSLIHTYWSLTRYVYAYEAVFGEIKA